MACPAGGASQPGAIHHRSGKTCLATFDSPLHPTTPQYVHWVYEYSCVSPFAVLESKRFSTISRCRSQQKLRRWLIYVVNVCIFIYAPSEFSLEDSVTQLVRVSRGFSRYVHLRRLECWMWSQRLLLLTNPRVLALIPALSPANARRGRFVLRS